MKCAICKEIIEPDATGWVHGHNAYPVVPNGRCCDICNMRVVVPARLAQMQRSFVFDSKTPRE